jgi:peptidyl-prolyl cis-trans isomerase C
MTRTRIALAVLAALALAGTAQAQPAAPKAAAPAAAPSAAPAAASSGKQLYPQSQFDFMLKERLAQGAPDSPELRNAIREELNTRELLVREAKKANLDKSADIKQQMDLAGQTVLVRAYVTDWIKKNPIPEAELKKEYEQIKSQMGDKEYKVKHILVEKEDEAKDCDRAAAEGRQVRRSREGALEGSGQQGPRRRPRLERARRLREAVRRRNGCHSEGQVHADAGADPVRLPRDPGRGRS